MARFKTLGDRIKAYESTFKQKLNPRMITVIRLDGKAFHTYTKGLARPFTKSLFENMETTTKYLVKNIQGCKIGYYQSDEITLLLTDYDNYDTESWFDGQVQKICSVSASMATSIMTVLENYDRDGLEAIGLEDVDYALQHYLRPTFDSRVFQVPSVTEAINCLIWRQQDCIRNSIQASARSLYSDKKTRNKNQAQMQELIFAKSEEFKTQIIKCGWGSDIDLDKENFNWNDLPDKTKRGTSVYYSNDKNYISKALDFKKESDIDFVRNLLPILDDYYGEEEVYKRLESDVNRFMTNEREKELLALFNKENKS